jgi:hypothetical protein
MVLPSASEFRNGSLIGPIHSSLNHPAASFPIHYSLTILLRFLISVIDDSQWQASRLGCFNHG